MQYNSQHHNYSSFIELFESGNMKRKGTNQKKMNIFKKAFLIIFKTLLCGKISQTEDTSFKKFNLSHLILTFNFNFVMLFTWAEQKCHLHLVEKLHVFCHKHTFHCNDKITARFFKGYLCRDIARNFQEGGSKSSEMSTTMVGQQRKIWVAEWLNR